jgi:hypothetical protein
MSFEIRERPCPTAEEQASCEHEFRTYGSLMDAMIIEMCQKCMFTKDRRPMTDEEADAWYKNP